MNSLKTTDIPSKSLRLVGFLRWMSDTSIIVIFKNHNDMLIKRGNTILQTEHVLLQN